MEEILKQLKIKADVVGVERNGTVERFLLKLQPGEKLSKLKKHTPEIELQMKAPIKVEPILEKGLVGIDIIKNHNIITFDSLIHRLGDEDIDLPIIVGKSIFGDDLVLDLTKLPHLLVAGSTQSGKSVLLHSIVSSLVCGNKDVDLILVDPKTVELKYYDDIKNLICPVITDSDSALKILSDLVDEMNDRFILLSKKKVNNIKEYNKKVIRKLPYIVIVIDELADLIHIFEKDFQKLIRLLAQKSRACGIHMVIATQRPSVDIITGSIKANFPARISFRVPSIIDSRVILDTGGAEKLGGSGDGLIISPQHNLIRFKCAYLSTEQIEKIVSQNKIGIFSKILRALV